MIKWSANMYSFYEIFLDRRDLGGLFFVGGGVLIFERIEILGESACGTFKQIKKVLNTHGDFFQVKG